MPTKKQLRLSAKTVTEQNKEGINANTANTIQKSQLASW